MIETELKIRHLLNLLDDDSPRIQKILKETLLENSFDVIIKRPLYLAQTPSKFRSVFIDRLHTIHQDLVINAWRQLVRNNLEDISLEKSVLLLSFWNDEDLDVPGIILQLDEIAKGIGNTLPISGHPLTFVDHLNYYLTEKYGFRGNSKDYYNPDNSFLDKVLQNRHGIPITLSILYLLISQRLNIPVLGVPMPAHFILKFDDGSDEVFFDPFNQGRIYSRQECMGYLNYLKSGKVDEILSGASNFEIILRMMRNLKLVFTSYKNEREKASELAGFMKILEDAYQAG